MYKQAVLRFPLTYHTELLAWYDKQIFGKDTITESSSAMGTGSLVQGLEDVEDLVERLHHAEVTASHSLVLSPSVQPMATEPSPPLVPCTPSLANGAPDPDQMGQPVNEVPDCEQNTAKSGTVEVTRKRKPKKKGAKN